MSSCETSQKHFVHFILVLLETYPYFYILTSLPIFCWKISGCQFDVADDYFRANLTPIGLLKFNT